MLIKVEKREAMLKPKLKGLWGVMNYFVVVISTRDVATHTAVILGGAP